MSAPELSAEAALARFAVGAATVAIPERVLGEGRRSLLNMFATALAGSGEPAIDIAASVLTPFAGPATCGVIGRPERTDLPTAAFLNAASANIFDFDDTHPGTIIHPTAPVAPVLLALAETRPVTGAELLRAFIVGAEVECRLGLAVSPDHYARGWHITSTCGVVGAAVAASVVLRLDERQTGWAIANACGQSAGMVETLGTMTKSLSVGNAARGGLMAALLAQKGFSGPDAPLTGQRGILHLYADTPRAVALSQDLGTRWDFADNTYKPYPVGVVLNPVIDAAAELRKDGVALTDIADITLRGHPLLRQRADRPDVATGREAQVSAQHAFAVALSGEVGLADFTDDAVTGTLTTGRPGMTFEDDATMDIGAVALTARMTDGTERQVTITAARGSTDNPMTNAQIEDKLRALAAYRGVTWDTQPLIDAVWSLDTLPDAARLAALACRAPTTEVAA